jgi:hypothetical protein
VARPCANPFCDKHLHDDAPRNKKWCDDNTCGREGRRIRRNKNRARDYHRAEAFWARLPAIRRLTPGQMVKGGTSRRAASRVAVLTGDLLAEPT